MNSDCSVSRTVEKENTRKQAPGTDPDENPTNTHTETETTNSSGHEKMMEREDRSAQERRDDSTQRRERERGTDGCRRTEVREQEERESEGGGWPVAGDEVMSSRWRGKDGK